MMLLYLAFACVMTAEATLSFMRKTIPNCFLKERLKRAHILKGIPEYLTAPSLFAAIASRWIHGKSRISFLLLWKLAHTNHIRFYIMALQKGVDNGPRVPTRVPCPAVLNPAWRGIRVEPSNTSVGRMRAPKVNQKKTAQTHSL